MQNPKTYTVVMRVSAACAIRGLLEAGETYEIPYDEATRMISKGLAETPLTVALRREAELKAEAVRTAEYERLCELLRGLDLTLKIESCGCCGGPWVEVQHQGTQIIKQQGDFNSEEDL